MPEHLARSSSHYEHNVIPCHPLPGENGLSRSGESQELGILTTSGGRIGNSVTACTSVMFIMRTAAGGPAYRAAARIRNAVGAGRLRRDGTGGNRGPGTWAARALMPMRPV